jgi:hypothetical protein
MKPASFDSILRHLFEGQQQLPWTPYPMSDVMKTETYRRFNYCVTSGGRYVSCTEICTFNTQPAFCFRLAPN